MKYNKIQNILFVSPVVVLITSFYLGYIELREILIFIFMIAFLYYGNGMLDWITENSNKVEREKEPIKISTPSILIYTFVVSIFVFIFSVLLFHPSIQKSDEPHVIDRLGMILRGNAEDIKKEKS